MYDLFHVFHMLLKPFVVIKNIYGLSHSLQMNTGYSHVQSGRVISSRNIVFHVFIYRGLKYFPVDSTMYNCVNLSQFTQIVLYSFEHVEDNVAGTDYPSGAHEFTQGF
jgi:hypothetical protein